MLTRERMSSKTAAIEPTGPPVEELGAGETRREEILAAATRLFAARGFDGTSTREIAREAGAKHSLLFYHFGSKADLYLAAVLDQLEHLGAKVQDALAAESDPLSRLHAYVEVYYDCFTTREPGLRVCLRELNGLPPDLARQIAEAHNRKSMAALQEIIADGIRLGLFREFDARASAFAITGILHMFLRMRPNTRNTFPPHEAVRQVLDVYCDGLVTRT
jgi:TetR/AcrR family transcriptional regulator, fatty acid metabolism regulator protein